MVTFEFEKHPEFEKNLDFDTNANIKKKDNNDNIHQQNTIGIYVKKNISKTKSIFQKNPIKKKLFFYNNTKQTTQTKVIGKFDVNDKMNIHNNSNYDSSVEPSKYNFLKKLFFLSSRFR